MNLEQFRNTLAGDTAPAVGPLLLALWHDARGNWDQAHRIAQDVDTPDGAWVHAYLHRREGDVGNARYWYRHAGRPEATDELDVEWTRIAEALLGVR